MIDVFSLGARVIKVVENTWDGVWARGPNPRRNPEMKWNRSNTVGLASTTCCYCQGGGLRLVYNNHPAPCGCVFRAIFRACLNRFRECAIAEGISGTVSWEFCSGSGGGC